MARALRYVSESHNGPLTLQIGLCLFYQVSEHHFVNLKIFLSVSCVSLDLSAKQLVYKIR